MNEDTKTTEVPPEETKGTPEPGLTDSIGSFPVWMLKAIDFVTPDFLTKPATPRKDDSEGEK